MEFNLTNADWIQIEIDGKNYSFKSFFDEASLELLIFDLRQCKFYILKQHRVEILKIFKDLNPCMEASLFKILSILKESFSRKNSAAVFTINPLIDDPKMLKLQLKTKIAGVNFYFEFDLSTLDSLLVKDYFLVPLLYSNAEFQHREAELIKIINNKDREIEDFRSQGAKLARNNLKTEKFDTNRFNESIYNRNEVNSDLVKNPDSVLHTCLSHIVHHACIKRYYSDLKESCNSINISKTQPKTEKHEAGSYKSEPEDLLVKSGHSKTNDDTNAYDQADRLKMLKHKIKEEKVKTDKRTLKKKKLF